MMNKSKLLIWLRYLEDYKKYLTHKPCEDTWNDMNSCNFCTLAIKGKRLYYSFPERCQFCVWTEFSNKYSKDLHLGICLHLWMKKMGEYSNISKDRVNRQNNFIKWRLPILDKQIRYIKKLIKEIK